MIRIKPISLLDAIDKKLKLKLKLQSLIITRKNIEFWKSLVLIVRWLLGCLKKKIELKLNCSHVKKKKLYFDKL